MKKKIQHFGKPVTLDVRDRLYQRHLRIGAPSIAEIPDEYHVGGSISDNNQMNGLGGPSNFCTDYSVVALAEREDGKEYSREYHAQKETAMQGSNVQDAGGSDMRTAFKVGTISGFLEKALATIDWKQKGASFAADPKNWGTEHDNEAGANRHPGYTWVTGPYDLFDSARAALYDKRPNGSLAVASPWYASFQNVGKNGILPMPAKDEQPQTFHSQELCGMMIKNGVPVIVCNSWQGNDFGDGGAVYYTREVFNFCFKQWGTAIGSLDPVDPNQVSNLQKQVYSLLQILVEMLTSIRDRLLYSRNQN